MTRQSHAHAPQPTHSHLAAAYIRVWGVRDAQVGLHWHVAADELAGGVGGLSDVGQGAAARG